jgi:hypothetical protein
VQDFAGRRPGAINPFLTMDLTPLCILANDFPRLRRARRSWQKFPLPALTQTPGDDRLNSFHSPHFFVQVPANDQRDLISKT